MSLGVAGRGVVEAERAAGAVWPHAVLHGLLGGVHPSYRPRGAPTGQASHPEDRAKTPDVTHADQAVDAQDDLLLQVLYRNTL